MEAIINDGGKQYWVDTNSKIYIERKQIDPGKKIFFDDIIMIKGVFDKNILSKLKITGIVEKHSKLKKVKVFMYKPKKNNKRLLGHRQEFTQVKIINIPNIND